MAETLSIPQGGSKEDIYREILPQIRALMEGEDNLTANLANIAAVLDMAFGRLWTGFYLNDGDTLVLGPFQGPLACTRIPLKPVPKGVCGAAADKRETLIVPDVDKFPGHIACSGATRSEIVVPLVHAGETRLVLDIDSAQPDAFDATDKHYLEDLVDLIRLHHYACA